MSTKTLPLSLLAFCCLVLVLGACGGGDAGQPAAAAAPSSAPEAPGDAPEAAPAADPQAADDEVADGELTGVASCDEFITKYRRCLEEKIPTSEHHLIAPATQRIIDAWRQSAQIPESRAGLDDACAQMIEMQRDTMTAYGCDW